MFKLETVPRDLMSHALRALNPLLGGSWVVLSKVLSRVTMLISHIRGLITPLITAHEPPSKPTHHKP